jgi:hypothetical protein
MKEIENRKRKEEKKKKYIKGARGTPSAQQRNQPMAHPGLSPKPISILSLSLTSGAWVSSLTSS